MFKYCCNKQYSDSYYIRLCVPNNVAAVLYTGTGDMTTAASLWGRLHGEEKCMQKVSMPVTVQPEFRLSPYACSFLLTKYLAVCTYNIMHTQAPPTHYIDTHKHPTHILFRHTHEPSYADVHYITQHY